MLPHHYSSKNNGRYIYINIRTALSVAEVGAARYLLRWPRCQHIHDINVRRGSRCVSINQNKRAAVAAAPDSTCSRPCYHVKRANKPHVAKTGAT